MEVGAWLILGKRESLWNKHRGGEIWGKTVLCQADIGSSQKIWHLLFYSLKCPAASASTPKEEGVSLAHGD